MADKQIIYPMMILKNYHLDYNSWLKRLDTQLIEPINQNSIKVHKEVKQTNKKNSLPCIKDQLMTSYYKILGTSVINSPMSPPSLINPVKSESIVAHSIRMV